MRLIRLPTFAVLLAFLLTPFTGTGGQESQLPFPQDQQKQDQDRKLPNGKSWNISIAKDEHEKALKDADELILLARQLKSELEKSGDFVVPVSSLRKTEDIEKVAKRIRGRLRG